MQAVAEHREAHTGTGMIQASVEARVTLHALRGHLRAAQSGAGHQVRALHLVCPARVQEGAQGDLAARDAARAAPAGPPPHPTLEDGRNAVMAAVALLARWAAACGHSAVSSARACGVGGGGGKVVWVGVGVGSAAGGKWRVGAMSTSATGSCYTSRRVREGRD